MIVWKQTSGDVFMEASSSGSIVTIPISIKVLNAQTIVTANHVQVSGTGNTIRDALKSFRHSLIHQLGLRREEAACYEYYWSEAAHAYCDFLAASILRHNKTIESKFRDSEDLDTLVSLMTPTERHYALTRSWHKICRWRHRENV